MDLETENRIAAILMKEAAELRRQSAKDGIDAYLRPNIRGRPNSRFLTATVLGVQQSNRAVEVNEMWRARQKEKELDDRKRGRSNSDSQKNSNRYDEYERNHSSRCSSSKSASEDGLRDNEIEEFLHSRAKRGRGAVGSRMDEPGPYLPDSKEKHLVTPDDLEYREIQGNRVVLGPEKPRKHKSYSSLDEESSSDESERSSKRVSSKKRRSKDKSKDKKKKKSEKKRSKHRNRLVDDSKK
nr:CAX-interacting protein 4 [Tanacetum cinerariifolium]